MSHVLYELARATAGFALAYVVARVVIARLYADAPIDGGRLLVELPLHLAIAGGALVLTSAIPIWKDLLNIRNIVIDNERELRDSAGDQRFLRDVHDAFEMAETEIELFEITSAALTEIADEEIGGSEVLVADSSEAHLDVALRSGSGSAPGCGVLTPFACPAVRRGQTLRFDDPTALSACPRLRERGLGDEMGSTCVPITVFGTPTAVLHSTYEFIADERIYQKKVARLEGVAVQFGTRLGLLRAMSKSQLQADTDPLTGLLNRRSMENRVRAIRADGIEFAVAMLDLDNFKNLNDTYGHDSGDRALRMFSRVLQNSVRDEDIVCRHGGEEFVVVVVGADVTNAAAVFHRLRDDLEKALEGSQVPPFTVSVGLCDSTWSDDLQTLLQSADRALLLAKAQGRDCLVIDDPSTAPTSLSHRTLGDRSPEDPVSADIAANGRRSLEAIEVPGPGPEPRSSTDRDDTAIGANRSTPYE